MFEWLKDYKKFRDEIRNVKIEDFNDLKKLLEEAEKLKTELISQKTRHENEIMSLNHAINLEKERVRAEKDREIATLRHEITLQQAEFDKQKEAMLLKAQQEIGKQREEFLEKNFSDLKEGVDSSFDRAMKSLDVFVKRLPSFRAKRIEHEGNDKGININVDADTDKE